MLVVLQLDYITGYVQLKGAIKDLALTCLTCCFPTCSCELINA